MKPLVVKGKNNFFHPHYRLISGEPFIGKGSVKDDAEELPEISYEWPEDYLEILENLEDSAFLPWAYYGITLYFR